MTSNGARKPQGGNGRRLEGAALVEHPSFLLARANARSLSLGNAALHRLGLKVRSYSVLALASGDERPSQRELASFLRLDPSQVVPLVDELEAKGLVERMADPRDRRANVVQATDAGLKLLGEARKALAAVDNEVFEGLTDDQRVTLTEMLGRIAFHD